MCRDGTARRTRDSEETDGRRLTRSLHLRLVVEQRVPVALSVLSVGRVLHRQAVCGIALSLIEGVGDALRKMDSFAHNCLSAPISWSRNCRECSKIFRYCQYNTYPLGSCACENSILSLMTYGHVKILVPCLEQRMRLVFTKFGLLAIHRHRLIQKYKRRH